MLIADYLNDYVGESEAPLRYHQWCLVGAIAALLGRRYKLAFGHKFIYPNMYTMLIGGAGSRKSSAIELSVAVLKATGYTRLAAESTSKEKFLLDLSGHKDNTGFKHTAEAAGMATGSKNFRDLFDGIDSIEGNDEPCEMLIAADEFVVFIGSGNFDFISLLGTLWDNRDKHEPRLKNSKSYLIKEPCVNILSGNTPVGFTATFPPETIGQGFLSRLILVHGERTDKRIDFPVPPNPARLAKFVAQVEDIRNTVQGIAELTPDAKQAAGWLYNNWQELDDMRFSAYSNRRYTHMLKLGLIFSAMDKRMMVTLDDIISANTLLTVTEADMPKALGEFGKGKYSDVSSKVVDYITKFGMPQDVTQIWKHVNTDLEKISQLTDILIGLVKADKLQHTKLGFLPKIKIKQLSGEFFDLKLIGGI